MTETQREFVPREDGGELDTALAFLRFARHCVLKKTGGLEEDQLRRALVPSGTSLLGLVQHLAESERYWFGYHVAGHPDTDITFGMDLPTGRDAATVVADYEAASAESDAILTAIGDLETPVSRPIDDQLLSVRWVMAHMTGETARHAGHADILREQLDGVTGR
ncbi:MAG TPA: DinB family protein [Actinomycetes bacterium]|nr:DinB family protein [Actinomycetes bacterium]